MDTFDITALQSWVGRQETRCDVISVAPVTAMSATLDYKVPRAGVGDPLPIPWHWLYFLPASTTSELDVDGHPRRGGFLPPVPLPRRMWAASSIRFKSPLYVGDEVRRISTIQDVSYKTGSSGELVFVTVAHHILRDDVLVIEEQQNLVYRESSTGNATPPVRPIPAQAQWSRQIRPDPVLLFRFSALTFNSHRIHYDRDYATQQEGYDGLVVQGPLTAALLLDLLYRELPGAQVASFEFRGVRPLLDGESFQLQGRRDGESVKLWACDGSGALAMDAVAQLL